MFGSKKDPLVDAVKKVMEGNDVRRQVERDLNSELGIYSRQVLPNEYHSKYDSMLSEKTKIALNEELKGGDPNRATVFSGAVTDTKTGNKVPSPTSAKPPAPPKPTAPRYSGADKNALDQKFVAAATEVLKPTTPASTASKTPAAPAKPMSDKEALDQKFKDAAAELDEANNPVGRNPLAKGGSGSTGPGLFKRIKDKINPAGRNPFDYPPEANDPVGRNPLAKKKLNELTGKGKLASIYLSNIKNSRTAPDEKTSDEHHRIATRAAAMISNLATKNAFDDELAKYGKKRSKKMPYKGPKYKAMEEESLDETSLAKAKRYVKANIEDQIERAEYRGFASGRRGDDYPKGLFKNPADNIDPSDVRRQKGLNMVMNKKVPFTAEEAMDEVFNTEKGEATRKRYIKGAKSELDRNSALMKDVDKGDKRAIARMKSREDGVFNAQRRKKLGEDTFESVMEEIRARLGEARLRQIAEDDNADEVDGGSNIYANAKKFLDSKKDVADRTPNDGGANSSSAAPAVPANAARMAPGAMTGSSTFKPEKPISPLQKAFDKDEVENTANRARSVPTVPAAPTARPVKPDVPARTAARPVAPAASTVKAPSSADEYSRSRNSGSDEVGGSAADLIRGDRAAAAERAATTTSKPAARTAARTATGPTRSPGSTARTANGPTTKPKGNSALNTTIKPTTMVAENFEQFIMDRAKGNSS